MELGGVARDPAYETAIQKASPGSDLDAEAAIAEAEAQLENKRVTRDEKVAALVINPERIRGKSQRQSRLTQKSKVPPPAPPTH